MKSRIMSSTMESIHNLAMPDTDYQEEAKERSDEKTYSQGVFDVSYKPHRLISLIPLPKSYLGKTVLVTILCAYLPLLASLFYVLTRNPGDPISKAQILLISLFSTILGISFTVYSLKVLLQSLLQVYCTLSAGVIDKKASTEFTIRYIDEIDGLMSNIRSRINDLHGQIESLRKTSMTDYLTGTYNRYSGEKRLKEDISRARRSGQSISLAMLDIDDFKLVNDRYGHDTGDFCLKHVVEIIKNNIRKGDWLIRWGGDEFILILFDSDEKSSEKIVGRICTALKEQPALVVQGQIYLSLSVGICKYDGDDDVDDLFKKTDTALLSAKRLGKSQMVFYPGSVSMGCGAAMRKDKS